MGYVETLTSMQCRYSNGNDWASTMTKNPIYVGTNSAGSYKYVGQWQMPGLDVFRGKIATVTLHIYRNSNNSTYARKQYVGCSTDVEDYASVLSTGILITLSAGDGWKSIDISGIAEYISEYGAPWYLLIGNPNDKGTYAEIAGYGSGKMLYLEVEYDNGSKIYLASNGELLPYQLYRAENGELVRYDLYRAESGSLIKY